MHEASRCTSESGSTPTTVDREAPHDQGSRRAVKTERVSKWVEAACTQIALGGYSHEDSASHRRSSMHARVPRPQQGQPRKPNKSSPCRHMRPSGDLRSSASCPHKAHAAAPHSQPPAAHKLPYARPLTIPEVNEEDDGGGGCPLPVVSETTGRSSSRWSSSRLCELEKLLSVDSDTSRTSDSGGAAATQAADNTAESCVVLRTPFRDEPPPCQDRELSPVRGCGHMPPSTSMGVKEVPPGMRRVWTPAALPLLHRTPLPHSERNSPVVGSPGGGCGLERSLTCYPRHPTVDMAAVMEAAMHMSPSSAELASRCLPSVTLTMPPASVWQGQGSMAYSRMGSCPGPVPYPLAPVRCGNIATG